MSLGERLRDYFSPREVVDTSPKVSDEVKYTTCYMCACRCGIKVHLKDGAIRYIEGNRNHPVNRGVICGKGASGIMQQHSPAKLRKPLKRVGERGSGEFREIECGRVLCKISVSIEQNASVLCESSPEVVGKQEISSWIGGRNRYARFDGGIEQHVEHRNRQ